MWSTTDLGGWVRSRTHVGCPSVRETSPVRVVVPSTRLGHATRVIARAPPDLAGGVVGSLTRRSERSPKTNWNRADHGWPPSLGESPEVSSKLGALHVRDDRYVVSRSHRPGPSWRFPSWWRCTRPPPASRVIEWPTVRSRRSAAPARGSDRHGQTAIRAREASPADEMLVGATEEVWARLKARQAPERVFRRAPERVFRRAPERVFRRAPERVFRRAPKRVPLSVRLQVEEDAANC
jgi:hypothetical protein